MKIIILCGTAESVY